LGVYDVTTEEGLIEICQKVIGLVGRYNRRCFREIAEGGVLPMFWNTKESIPWLKQGSEPFMNMRRT